jgi:hypothetical protein
MHIRRLQPSDFGKGYMALLGQLSQPGHPSQAEFTQRLE